MLPLHCNRSHMTLFFRLCAPNLCFIISQHAFTKTYLLPEMGIYRDNLSAIVIGDNFLSIIIIAENSLDLSITVIAFAIYFVIADKLSR